MSLERQAEREVYRDELRLVVVASLDSFQRDQFEVAEDFEDLLRLHRPGSGADDDHLGVEIPDVARLVGDRQRRELFIASRKQIPNHARVAIAAPYPCEYGQNVLFDQES